MIAKWANNYKLTGTPSRVAPHYAGAWRQRKKCGLKSTEAVSCSFAVLSAVAFRNARRCAGEGDSDWEELGYPSWWLEATEYVTFPKIWPLPYRSPILCPSHSQPPGSQPSAAPAAPAPTAPPAGGAPTAPPAGGDDGTLSQRHTPTRALAWAACAAFIGTVEYDLFCFVCRRSRSPSHGRRNRRACSHGGRCGNCCWYRGL